MKNRVLVALAALVPLVSGCGGGGGTSDSYSYETPVNSEGVNSSSNYDNQGNSGDSNSNETPVNPDSSTNTSNHDTSYSTIDAHSVNSRVLQSAIANNEIKGWSQSAKPKDLYLALLNYIRSLPIKCNDPQGFKGPSDPLKWDYNLELAAKEHSDDMLQNNYFSHTGSDGSSPVVRIKDNGFTGSSYGENIAYRHSKGFPYTGYEWIIAFAQLIDSKEGHCSNLMSKNFTHVGMYESKAVNGSEVTLYWTQDFGKK